MGEMPGEAGESNNPADEQVLSRSNEEPSASLTRCVMLGA